MLSRVADALYWMSRYIERAEQGARVLEVTRRVLIDLREVEPTAAEVHWQGALEALGLAPTTQLEQAVLDEHLVGSVASCMSRARENARQVRDVISSEMWDHLNQAYWALHETGSSRRRHEVISDTLGGVLRASFLWGGVSDATMGRDEGWLFVRLGQFIERADRTARVFDLGWRALQPGRRKDSRQSSDNVGWLALLRNCGSLEEYRKRHPTPIDPDRVLEFVVLDRLYPRTIRYSVMVSAEFARRLADLTSTRGEPAERAFGKLAARLDYTEIEDVLAVGASPFLRSVADDLGAAALALQRGYFLH